MMKCLIALVTLAVMLLEGNAIQCYICQNVVANGELQDESISCDSSTLVTCGDDLDACATSTLKWDTTVFGTRIQKTGLYYGCSKSTIREEDGCDVYKSTTGADECSIDFCTSERCNSGPTFTSGSSDDSSDDSVDDSSDDSVDDSSDDSVDDSSDDSVDDSSDDSIDDSSDDSVDNSSDDRVDDSSDDSVDDSSDDSVDDSSDGSDDGGEGDPGTTIFINHNSSNP